MNILEHARQVVSEYLLDPDDSVENVRKVRDDAVFVDSQKWTWWVASVPVNAPGWTVYDVSLDVMSDPAQRPDGFAVSDVGEVLRLSEKPGLESFLQAAGLPPVGLAHLLTRYHSACPAHLVERPEDLHRVVGEPATDQIEGLTAPQDAAGPLVFCTWCVVNGDTVRVDRWQVRVVDAKLTWQVDTLADRMPWVVGR